MYNNKLHFHFTGIAGVGMSGIAEILLNLGFTVSGSDLRSNEACQRLAKKGALVYQGHCPQNLPSAASLLVYSSAVKQDNVEVVEAKERGIPVVPRAEILAELMRLKFGVAVAGSHGKTTTTSLVAHILEQGGLDPTVIIGGQVQSMGGSGGKLGHSQYLVAESDESDRSFLLLKPTLAIVTNIDSEHLEAYDSLQHIESSFEQFINAVPFYGLAVLCVDDPRVRDIANRYTRRCITYGFSPTAELRASNLEQQNQLQKFDVVHKNETLFRASLPAPGRHMVLNSLAAVAVALEFGIATDMIEQALSSFSGVNRRLEVVGVVNEVTVINDYGHHPTEIRATIEAVKSGWQNQLGKLHVIFQPHRFTRTRDCFVDFLNAFEACDNLVLTDIYSAGEEPLKGIDGESLFSAINHNSKHFVKDLNQIAAGLVKSLSPGDVVLCLGAGSIGSLPACLIRELNGLVN